MVMKAWLVISLTVLVLAGCADQTEESAGAGEQPAAEVVPEKAAERDLAELARTDPDALLEAMRDPEQRQAVMEALRQQSEHDPGQAQRREEMRERMRQRREEILAERDGGEPGERMRERRAGARANWWEDETISVNLGLDEQQATSLGHAHQQFQETQRESRQTLALGQRQLHQALQGADRDRVEQLLQERHDASLALAEAERAWMSALLEQLSDEQIRTLAEDHPQALAPRFR